jgi:type II secretion system protein N
MARRARGLAARLLWGLGFGALSLLAIVGIAVAFFPFDRLAPALSARIQRETGVATRIESLGAALGLEGPWIEARGVTLRWPTGAVLELEAVRARPAHPGAWLRGVPTASVTADASFGSFDGDFSREAVSGTLERFDFAQLPADWFGEAGSPLAGAIDARVDITRIGENWTGSITLAGGEGSVALPGSPIAIPYERLDARARLDGRGVLHLDSLALAGPMLSARATGTIAAGDGGPATGVIEIEAEIKRLDPAFASALAPFGIALDGRGAGRLRVTGAAGQLKLR